MDHHWEYKDWKPSAVGQTPWLIPSENEVESLRGSLVKQTKDILDVPYNPAFWGMRSETLNHLGYPELAAGDAYKCILLVNESMNLQSQLGLEVRVQSGMFNWLLNLDHSLWAPGLPDDEIYILQERMAYYLDKCRRRAYRALCLSLKMILALPDLILTSQEALHLYPRDEYFTAALSAGRLWIEQKIKHYEASGMSLFGKRDELSSGHIFPRSYPWLTDDLKVRDKKTIDTAKHNLKQHSKVLSIRQSSLGGYGMFAKSAVKKGDILLETPTPFGVSYEQLDTDEQTSTQCYNCFQPLKDSEIVLTSNWETTPQLAFPCCPHMHFCSTDCKDMANAEYHAAVCGKDFSELYNRAQDTWGGKAKAGQLTELGKAGFDDDRQSGSYDGEPQQIYPSGIPLMLLRFLAICFQAGCHPLKHPVVALIVPNTVDSVQYVENYMPVTMPWQFYAHVTGAIKILQTLGVDVFADSRYDTWVLMSLWQRIKNNCYVATLKNDVPNGSLEPLYCLFNHSCLQNASLKNTPNSRVEVSAKADIAEGQEVCVSYCGSPDTTSGWKTRQKYLMNWLSGKCGCERCRLEQARDEREGTRRT